MGYYPVRPDLLRVVLDKSGGIEKYVFRSGGVEQDFGVDEIINVREPDPTNPNMGKSRLLAVSLEIDADLASAIWNRHLLENGAEPGGVLTTEQELSDKAFDRLKAQWEARHGGPANAGKTAILEMGLKYEKLAQTQKELDFIESRKYNRDTILTQLGIPTSLVDSTANRANAETAKRMFEEDTIDPIMGLFVDQLDAFLLPMYAGTDNMTLTYVSPISEDTEALLKEHETSINKWATVNEIREARGMEPLEGGDVLYYPISSFPTVGDVPPEAPVDPAKGSNVVVMKRQGTGSGISQKKRKYLKRRIDSKNFRRNVVIKSVTEAVTKTIAEKIGQSSGKIKVKGVKSFKGCPVHQKSDEGEGDQIELPEKVVQERKAYLKSLPKKERKFQTILKRFFTEQEAIVMENLEAQKGKNGTLTKGFIEDVIFDLDNQIGVLVALTADSIASNISDGAGQITNLMGVPLEDLTAIPIVINYVRDMPLKFSRQVNETTLKKLRKGLGEGLDNGEDLGAIGDRVAGVFKEARSVRTETIARTEVGKALNFGRYTEMKRQGIKQKVWVSILSNTRDAHGNNGANGQVRDIDESFSVGGQLLRYPQDPNGSAKNTINCQCNASPVLD